MRIKCLAPAPSHFVKGICVSIRENFLHASANVKAESLLFSPAHFINRYATLPSSKETLPLFFNGCVVFLWIAHTPPSPHSKGRSESDFQG